MALVPVTNDSTRQPRGVSFLTPRGWLASYDNRLSQNFWTRQASPGEGSSLESERLAPVASHTARRENFKKEHYATELDRIDRIAEEALVREKAIEGQSRKKLVRGKSKDSLNSLSLEELEKKVHAGCSVSEIDELVKNAHSQHRKFKGYIEKVEEYEEPKPQEKVEEVHHEHVHLHHRRRRSHWQRNPKQRVEDRIKREKEQWKETGEQPKGTLNLPMTQFAVQTERGKEEHALVDVQKLQAKCRGLSAHCSAKSLLEQQRLREQAANAKKPTDRCNQAELRALATLTWEDRVELAQKRKLEGHISTVFNKMGQMRSKYPKDIPDSLLNHLHAMQQGDFSWHEGDC